MLGSYKAGKLGYVCRAAIPPFSNPRCSSSWYSSNACSMMFSFSLFKSGFILTFAPRRCNS